MAINFDSALGIHDDAMLLRTQRAEIIANNIANADTPNYLARDIDFAQALEDAMLPTESTLKPVQLNTTNTGHMEGIVNPGFAAEMMYRTPIQASVDGNTVDSQGEMARYTENAVGFQASFTFLDRKFKGLEKAIKGE